MTRRLWPRPIAACCLRLEPDEGSAPRRHAWGRSGRSCRQARGQPEGQTGDPDVTCAATLAWREHDQILLESEKQMGPGISRSPAPSGQAARW